MALTLTVDGPALRTHVERTAAAFAGLVPVVKGNGYGFGRPALAAAARALGAAEVAVGTVHELRDVEAPRRLVLTPALAGEVAHAGPHDVLTVGHPDHVAAVARCGRGQPVLVKLASSMQRYGADAGELDDLLAAVRAAGLTVHGLSLHPPLAGTAADHAAEIERWLPAVPEGVAVYASHLDAPTWSALVERHPGRPWRIRLGTSLWLGDKSFVRATADVVQVRRVDAGTAAGYRSVPVPVDGHLVMVSAGSSHGVAPLADGRSPFHFARRRLALLEPPHMHTSMVVVPSGDPCPDLGDRVDVQRPLTTLVPDLHEGWPY